MEASNTQNNEMEIRFDSRSENEVFKYKHNSNNS